MNRTQVDDAIVAGEIGLHGEYIPTPDEIRRQCAEIRHSWSDKERQSRAFERNCRWVVPTFKVARWY